MLLSEMVALVHKEIEPPRAMHFPYIDRKTNTIMSGTPPELQPLWYAQPQRSMPDPVAKKLKISHRLALHQLPLMMELESQVTAA